jgi:hypothetical protein
VSGPWKSFNARIEGDVGSYSIAAPWLLDNGTAYWVLQATCPSWVCAAQLGGKCFGTCGTIIRGETWEGPYKVLGTGACTLGEDHSMYVDKRGFHCITHRFSDPASSGDGPYASRYDGGHAFSVDGTDRSWYCADGRGGHSICNLQSPIAYNSTIVYRKDGVNVFGTRERPHVLFDGETPVALTTSVQHCQAPAVPDRCVPGDPHSCNGTNLGACSNSWPGYKDRAWTSVSPLRTSKP